ncbi:MAG TPA: hypothetical protein VFB46_08165 [Gemmatimonadaceae bacterium]|nr:hypothetical protein [Gemmatimonadaceae bacterium]
MRRLVVVASLSLLSACISRQQLPPEPTPAERLAEALTSARIAASAGQREEADVILARFITAHASTPEAREAEYVRAILRLEAATSRADRDEAGRSLDVYLSDTAMSAHQAEARILRRLLAAVDSVSLATDSANVAARQAAAAREEELKKEIQTLKEQLDKTNEELTRIKRRLGSRP